MVECKALNVIISNKYLIENISFTANKGEITVITGKNGSGKTTLLKAISNNVSYSGDIFINNKNIQSFSKIQAARIISSMPQSLPKIPVSVSTLTGFGRHPYTGISGILSEKDNIIVQNALSEAEITELASRKVNTLSGGELRKAYFSMMLAQTTEVLLLDEPNAELDLIYQKHFLKMLLKRKSQGNTIICVLHDINQAIEIADRIILLENSRLMFDGTAKDFIGNELPQKHFGMQKLNYIDENGNKGVIFK